MKRRLCAVLVGLGCVAGPAWAGHGGLSWTAPQAVDGAPFAQPVALGAMRCRGDGTCLAGDARGRVLLITPGRAPRTLADGHGAITGVACLSSDACVAVDAAGESLMGGYGGGWTVRRVAPVPLSDVACFDASGCLAIGARGVLLGTADAGLSWTVTAFDAGHGPDSISCALGASLCAIGDRSGRVFTSGTPADPTSFSEAIAGPRAVLSLSCPTASLCVAGDAGGGVLSASQPLDPSSWTATGGVSQDGSALGAVSCTAGELCVAASASGPAWISSTPTDPAGGWAPVRLPAALQALSCPTAQFCAGGSATGSLLASARPTRAGSWRERPIDGVSAITSLACGVFRCYAGDDAGRLLVSPDGGVRWRAQPSGASGYPALYAIACPPAAATCLALATAGDVPGAGNQGGGAVFSGLPGRRWTRRDPPSRSSHFGIDALSCPLTRLCLARDEDRAIYAADPATLRWRVARRTEAALLGAACVSGLCLAPGPQAGTVRILSAAGRALGTVRVAPARVVAISCPASGFCAALDAAGHVAVSRHPFRVAAWSFSTPGDGAAAVTALACPRAGRCLAADSLGRVSLGRG